MLVIHDFIKKIINGVNKLVFPPACVLCGELLEENDNYICKACCQQVCHIKPPYCFRCGKEIKDDEKEFCEDCNSHTRSFKQGFPAVVYDELFSRSIAGFKYNNKREYAKYFAYEIVKSRGSEILDVKPDVLVPVPIHKKKKKVRGYNQATLLAHELSDIIKIPVDEALLYRKVNTAPQKNLDNEARELNLKKAFISGDKIVKYNSVMLVDDIYTTGATIEACTKALNEVGIEDVYYTSICIGRGY